MKHTVHLLFIAFMLNACGPTHVVVQSQQPVAEYQPAPEVTYQSFYDELSPYGQWIDYPGYGYVWAPAVSYGFKPYATNGHWVYTDVGWTWASDYQWGWAAFHYGRWFFDGAYGWMWIPGQEWAPAWVSWRSSQDYYGWAPLGPNVGYGSAYNPPANYWCFVPHQYVTNPHMNNYYVNESRNVTIINNTTIINNYNNGNSNGRNVYRGGPDAREVERASGAPVRPVAVREGNRPGEQINNNQFTIYRPRVNAAPANSGNNRPQRVEPLRSVRTNASPQNNPNPGPPANSNQPVNRGNERPVTQAPATVPPANNNNQYNNNNQSSTRPANQPVRTIPQDAPVPVNNNPASTRPANQPVRTIPQDAQPVNNNRDADARLQNAERMRHPQPANNPQPAATRPSAPAAATQNNAVPANRPAANAPRTNAVQQNDRPAANVNPPASNNRGRSVQTQPAPMKPVTNTNHPSNQKPLTRPKNQDRPEEKDKR